MATKISWTDRTLNVVTGCSRVSDGCRNCYAETLSRARGWTTLPWTATNAPTTVTLHPERLRLPYTWRKPQKVFVCSMGDVLHPQVPDAFLGQVFEVMCATPRHTYQLLSKRPERAAAWPEPFPPNCWVGTSVEDRKTLARLDVLRQVRAALRWVSFEPLLEDLGPLDLSNIAWCVIGGETGPAYRPMRMAWARSIRDQAVAGGVAVWFKQSSARHSETGTQLVEADGSRSTVRQFPG
jgi:protein gp37